MKLYHGDGNDINWEIKNGEEGSAPNTASLRPRKESPNNKLVEKKM